MHQATQSVGEIGPAQKSREKDASQGSRYGKIVVNHQNEYKNPRGPNTFHGFPLEAGIPAATTTSDANDSQVMLMFYLHHFRDN